jgi:hypothetical protein
MRLPKKMINSSNEKKVVAYLSPTEINKLKNQDIVKIKYEDEFLEVINFIEGLTINPQTQKIKVDFILPNKQTILSGKNVKILLSDKGETNMIPLSAISFEPNGTQEVLILTKDNILKRRLVEIKNNLSDGIIIKNGLKQNDEVIKYKNQFYSGQKVIPQK